MKKDYDADDKSSEGLEERKKYWRTLNKEELIDVIIGMEGTWAITGCHH